MQKPFGLSAFTLVELMVVIVIISILALGASRLNFKRLSEQQIVQIETHQVLASIREMRNNALIGKSTATGVTPAYWAVVISKQNQTVSYRSSPTQNVADETEALPDWKSKYDFKISSLTCSNLDNSNPESPSSVTIHFEGDKAFITNGCNPNKKRVSMRLEKSGIVGEIQMNLLTGVIENP